MSENNAKNQFNFKEVDSQIDLQDYLSKRESEIRDRLKQEHGRSKIRNWGILGVLTVCLIGLGVYSFSEISNNEVQLSQARNQIQQIAGMVDDTPSENQIPAITGDWFSIAPKTVPPREFIKSSETIDFEYLDGKKAKTTAFVANIKEDNLEKQLKTGIEVQVVEFDNKYNSKQFSDLVLEKLGEDFNIESRDINIPKNFKLTKISNSDEEFYTAVTEDNYYLIKLFRETKNIEKYENLNNFTDSILENLYLN
jgi:hypothetical protein